MIVVKKELCKACTLCVKSCPVGAVKVIEKLAVVQENCVSCGVCVRVCPFQAIVREVEVAAGLDAALQKLGRLALAIRVVGKESVAHFAIALHGLATYTARDGVVKVAEGLCVTGPYLSF